MSGQTTLGSPRTPPPASPRRRWGQRHLRLLGVLSGAGIVLVVAVLVLPRWVDDQPAAASRAPASWQRHPVSVADLPDRLGVQLRQVAVSGGGGLLDLRFQVVDPDKAAALHEAGTPPAVVDEATGLVVRDLLMGHAHSDPYKAAKTYYLVFENSANWITHGSRVTVLLGGVQVEHVVVK